MKIDEANSMLNRCPLVSWNMLPTRFIYPAHSSISTNNYVMTANASAPVRILLLFTNHLCLLRILTLRRQDFFSHLRNGSNKIEITPPVPPPRQPADGHWLQAPFLGTHIFARFGRKFKGYKTRDMRAFWAPTCAAETMISYLEYEQVRLGSE